MQDWKKFYYQFQHRCLLRKLKSVQEYKKEVDLVSLNKIIYNNQLMYYFKHNESYYKSFPSFDFYTYYDII